MTHPNLDTAEFHYDEGDPIGYRAGAALIGEQAGGKELSVKLFEIPAGENLCPYHYEYVEEWLIVLSGELLLRSPAGEETVRQGAVVRFPAGPDGAHKLTNRTTDPAPARALMFSSAQEPSVAVYPDSDKIGVWVSNEADNLMVRRADGKVGYYEGEGT